MKLLLKKSVNMFERTEIAEYMYEGAIEHSIKNPTRDDANRAGLRSKMR